MQQAPAPAGSPALQRLSDPQAQTPIMPSPELPREGAEPSPSRGPSEQVTEDFKFLNCQGCQTQAKCPKLLPCLHTLCSGCLQMPSLRCPVCQAPHSPDETSVLDNVFFESLQRRLAVHKQVVDMQAICTRCKESADFWCFECEQLLCSKCFEAHQWFLKHEARPLAELRSQSVLEFLEGTRKSNNIFCSNPNHRTPTLTSIYCRGCNKPLCCSCALLDSSHSDLKCDLSSEIQQRQDKLDAVAHALQEREGVFGATHAQVNEAMEQLARARSEAEKLIQERISQVVAYLKERENELLQAVHTCYQREYKEMASQLRHLDSVLQRIRTGGLLVQRMKRYASDQEVLDMHNFLQGALNSLRLEEPRSQETSAMSTNSLNEIKVRLQDLVSHVTQATDVILSKKVSPELANTPSDLPGAELPDETQKIEGLGLVDAQSMAVVQPEPGAHPVPLYAYSIKDQSNGKKNLDSRPGDKRKSCSTQCSSKMIKLESEKKEEEEEEEWPAWNSPEQPRPSTSSAASESHLDGTPDLGSLVVRNNIAPSHNNHAAGDKDDNTEEAGDVVVLSGSEDSDDTERPPRQELDSKSNESRDLKLEGPRSPRLQDQNGAEPPSEDSHALVFFELKIDNETQKISQLAAVNREDKFCVILQPQAIAIRVPSMAVSLETGIQRFISFLNTLHHPVLVCYAPWGPRIPIFFRALEEMDKLDAFQKATSGFLAFLPLIRGLVPNATSYLLNSLAETYLGRSIKEGNALEAVLAMRDLCRHFQVRLGPRLTLNIFSVSSLQCFSSLQPLVKAAVLSRPDAGLLALRKVGFQELLSAHRDDPQQGLERYLSCLNLRLASSTQAFSGPKLRALSAYFKNKFKGASGLA